MKKVILCMCLFSLVPVTTVWPSDILRATSRLVSLLRSSQPQISAQFAEPVSFLSIAKQAGKAYKVDPRLILSVIKHESDFNPNAVSVKGAKGLMQLMPETAALVGVENSFDPAQNIYGGTKYLQQMIQRFNGDIYAALLAYNAGPTRVLAGNIPAESHRYASSVLSLYRRLRRQL